MTYFCYPLQGILGKDVFEYVFELYERHVSLMSKNFVFVDTTHLMEEGMKVDRGSEECASAAVESEKVYAPQPLPVVSLPSLDIVSGHSSQETCSVPGFEKPLSLMLSRSSALIPLGMPWHAKRLPGPYRLSLFASKVLSGEMGGEKERSSNCVLM